MNDSDWMNAMDAIHEQRAAQCKCGHQKPGACPGPDNCPMHADYWDTEEPEND